MTHFHYSNRMHVAMAGQTRLASRHVHTHAQGPGALPSQSAAVARKLTAGSGRPPAMVACSCMYDEGKASCLRHGVPQPSGNPRAGGARQDLECSAARCSWGRTARGRQHARHLDPTAKRLCLCHALPPSALPPPLRHTHART